MHWNISTLGEGVILLKGPTDIPIASIHQTTLAIEHILGVELRDIVPAYDSIALFTDLEKDVLLQKLAIYSKEAGKAQTEKHSFEIPICYELGLDLAEVCSHTGLSEREVIDIHLQGNYTSLFIGFTPGFIYADGLDSRLSCPRKSDPRTHISPGSIGIGGDQTGIYSLESPGGWNIIGRTPITLFDPDKNPPMTIEVGVEFSFKRISKQEFEQWEK